MFLYLLRFSYCFSRLSREAGVRATCLGSMQSLWTAVVFWFPVFFHYRCGFWRFVVVFSYCCFWLCSKARPQLLKVDGCTVLFSSWASWMHACLCTRVWSGGQKHNRRPLWLYICRASWMHACLCTRVWSGGQKHTMTSCAGLCYKWRENVASQLHPFTIFLLVLKK